MARPIPLPHPPHSGRATKNITFLRLPNCGRNEVKDKMILKSQFQRNGIFYVRKVVTKKEIVSFLRPKIKTTDEKLFGFLYL